MSLEEETSVGVKRDGGAGVLITSGEEEPPQR